MIKIIQFLLQTFVVIKTILVLNNFVKLFITKTRQAAQKIRFQGFLILLLFIHLSLVDLPPRHSIKLSGGNFIGCGSITLKLLGFV
jgi:hypothetical protein